MAFDVEAVKAELIALFASPRGRKRDGDPARSLPILQVERCPNLIEALESVLPIERTDGALKDSVDAALVLAERAATNRRPMRPTRASAIRAYLLFDTDAAEAFRERLEATQTAKVESITGIEFRDGWARAVETGTEQLAVGAGRTKKDARDEYVDGLTNAMAEALDHPSEFRKAFEDVGRQRLGRVFEKVREQIDVAPSKFPRAIRPSLVVDIANEAGVASSLMRKRRANLVGGPGVGKSTILAAVVAIVAEEGRPTIFARFSQLAELAVAHPPKGPSQAAAVVVAAFADWLNYDLTEAERSTLQEVVLSNASVLVALDGLDQVYESDRREAVFKTLEWLEAVPGQIIVSTRPMDVDRTMLHYETLSPGPFTTSHSKKFVKLWFSEGNRDVARERATAALAGTGHRAFDSPLLVSLMLYVADHSAESDTLPATAIELYESFIEVFLERAWTGRARPVEKVSDLLRAATDLAWAMAQTSATGDDWRDFVRARELVESGHRPELLELLREDGLLVEHGSHRHVSPLDRQYQWLHVSFHEHLVAKRLAALVRSDPSQARVPLRVAAQNVRNWNVVLHHLVELLEAGSRDVLVRLLLAERADGDPAGIILEVCKALVSFLPHGSPLIAAVVDAALETRDWEFGFEWGPALAAMRLAERLHEPDGALDFVFDTPPPSLELPIDLLIGVCEFVVEHDPGYNAVPWIAELSARDPDQAISVTLRRAAKDWWASPVQGEFLRDQAVAERALRASRELAFPENVGLLGIALRAGWEPRGWDDMPEQELLGVVYQQRTINGHRRRILALQRDDEARKTIPLTDIAKKVLVRAMHEGNDHAADLGYEVLTPRERLIDGPTPVYRLRRHISVGEPLSGTFETDPNPILREIIGGARSAQVQARALEVLEKYSGDLPVETLALMLMAHDALLRGRRGWGGESRAYIDGFIRKRLDEVDSERLVAAVKFAATESGSLPDFHLWLRLHDRDDLRREMIAWMVKAGLPLSAIAGAHEVGREFDNLVAELRAAGRLMHPRDGRVASGRLAYLGDLARYNGTLLELDPIQEVLPGGARWTGVDWRATFNY